MIQAEMSALAEELGKRIIRKYYELIQSPEMSFHEVIPMKTGVYVISEQNRVLYVGSALDLDRRLKHDLLGTMGQIAQPHTFGRKLVRNLATKKRREDIYGRIAGLESWLRKICKKQESLNNLPFYF